MKFTDFLKSPEVVGKLKPLRLKGPRKIGVSVKVEPRTKNFPLVGTAFDYLLRFELQRRAPHAKTRPWIAEGAPDCIWKQDAKGRMFMKLPTPPGATVDFSDPAQVAREAAKRARKVVDDAKNAVAVYLRSSAPSQHEQADLAAHSIRLGKLDALRRAWHYDPTFAEAHADDVRDLVELLAIVPFESLVHREVLHLNPVLDSDSLVGGTDADLIADDLLVDFKTTIKPDIQAPHLDQMLGYLLLTRHQRIMNPTFPEIRRLGLYFCRHGHLWTQDTAAWTAQPHFLEIEQWFFEYAKQVYGQDKRPKNS